MGVAASLVDEMVCNDDITLVFGWDMVVCGRSHVDVAEGVVGRFDRGSGGRVMKADEVR